MPEARPRQQTLIIVKRAITQPRLASILCLLAFTVLTISANLHTCCAARHRHARVDDIPAIAEVSHHHHCMACWLTLNCTGRTTITPVFSLQAGHVSVPAVVLPSVIYTSVVTTGNSSRSPPPA